MSDARQLPDYYCVKCEQRRTQGCFRRSCPGIPAHYVISDIERDLAADHAEAATLRAELEEARASVSEMEGALRASGALNQKLLDEVDRLRALTTCRCGDHFTKHFEGICPNCIAAGKESKP